MHSKTLAQVRENLKYREFVSAGPAAAFFYSANICRVMAAALLLLFCLQPERGRERERRRRRRGNCANQSPNFKPLTPPTLDTHFNTRVLPVVKKCIRFDQKLQLLKQNEAIIQRKGFHFSVAIFLHGLWLSLSVNIVLFKKRHFSPNC